VGGGFRVGGCGRLGVGLCVGRGAAGTNEAGRCGVTRKWGFTVSAGRLGVACVPTRRGAIVTGGGIVTVGAGTDGPNASSVTTDDGPVGSKATRQR
jgi:hypothetical protein